MTNDTVRDLSQHPLAQRLGMPRIPVLRRHEPGQALLDGPALVSEGPLAPVVRAVLTSHGAAEAGPEGHLAAIVVDASGARTLDDLASAQQILTPAVRRLGRSGRLIVLGPDSAATVGTAAAVTEIAVAQALEGLIRSAAKEVRGGATANLIAVAPGAEAALASPLAFLLSARSAFVSGQVVRVRAQTGPLTGPSPRIAVVTGAARGIGAAIATVLAREGATVIAVDVPAAGEALAALANRVGGTALQLDITAPDAADRLVEHVGARHGRLDVLVHNAGITRDRLLANMDDTRWAPVVAVNLAAQLTITEQVMAADLLSDTGRVVAISSTTGIAGNRGQTNYAATKAGVIGMVRALAPVLDDRGATANAIAPGFIETEMTARMPTATREGARRINSLRQGGLPVDVAEAVAWLGQADAAGVTGQVLRVCGQSMVGA